MKTIVKRLIIVCIVFLSLVSTTNAAPEDIPEVLISVMCVEDTIKNWDN